MRKPAKSGARRACAVGLLVLTGPAAASNIVVNSTADTVANDGFCTLREAITAAAANAALGAASGECAGGNPAPGVDQITFAIPPADPGCSGTPKVCTIKPATALPDITGGPVDLDGYTQAGALPNTLAVGDNAVLTIEIDASNMNPALRIAGEFNGGVSGKGSTIRGIALTHIAGNGLCVSCSFGVDASNVTIVGNFIGTDVTGTANTSGGTALYVQTSTNVTIGGTAPADRNVIASNDGGIYISASNGGTVQGNYLDVDKSGTTTLGAARGIDVEASDGVVVGGSAAGAGNVVSGQSSAMQVNSTNTIIQGNFFGTDPTGTVSNGSGAYGIVVAGGTGTVIGGTAAGEGNIVSGNGFDGIILSGSPTATTIQGNLIGTDITGRQPLPNGECGINANSFAGGTNGLIGGTAIGAGNVIAFNTTNGIGIGGASNVGWSILGNSMFNNGDLGISFNGRCDDHSSVPVANDPGDVDAGANNLQNYPAISAVTVSPTATTVHVSGSLNSSANTQYRLEFFANAGCDLDGNHGQGKIFLGFADVTTVGNDVSFGPLDFATPRDRHVISATATDPAGNTSEFSLCSDQDTIFSDGLEGD